MARQILGDMGRALGVLALLLFALGVSPGPDVQAGGPTVATAIAQTVSAELCGSGIGDPAAHFACHACRTGAPVLPSAPCEAVPVRFSSARIAYAAEAPLAEASVDRPHLRQRGPPVA